MSVQGKWKRLRAILISSLDDGLSQGGGEKRKLFSEKTEKTRRKRERKVFCSLF
jgi:hypothetical protein